MTADCKTMLAVKKKIAIYVVGMFSLVLMAAVGGKNSNPEKTLSADGVEMNVSVKDGIAAFKRSGAQKEVNNRYYAVEDVISHAKALIGTPHVMGGYSSRGIDCSGLVRLAHAKAEVELPRSSHEQARYGTIISSGQELKRGDLLFFHSTYRKANLITHTGIYLGNGEFVHASSRRGVTVSRLDSDYYRKHYLFATRLGR